MVILKGITTWMILLLMFIVFMFSRNISGNDEEKMASRVGFGFMQLVYVLSIVCIWI